MSGPHLAVGRNFPDTEARVSSSNNRPVSLKSLPRIERTSRLSGPLQAPALATSGKTHKTVQNVFRKRIIIDKFRSY